MTPTRSSAGSSARCHVGLIFSFGWSRSLRLKALVPSLTKDLQSLQRTKNMYLGSIRLLKYRADISSCVDVDADVDESERVLIVCSLQTSNEY